LLTEGMPLLADSSGQRPRLLTTAGKRWLLVRPEEAGEACYVPAMLEAIRPRS
jgi:hypothetical protein